MKTRARTFSLVALLLFLGSLFCLLSYIGQGMAGSDLVGVPGREADVHLLWQRAGYALDAAIVLQVCAIGTLSLILPLGATAGTFMRIVVRIAVATGICAGADLVLAMLFTDLVPAIRHF